MDFQRLGGTALILAAAGMVACKASAPRSINPVQAQKPAVVPQRPPAPHPPTVNQPPASYFNNQYHFTCTIPDGFILTHESEGPGEIMTLVPTSMSSSATADLSVRTTRLGNLTLEQYVNSRITNDLQGDPNVAHWDKFPASYGSYSGFEVTIERQYASGPFKSKIFCFLHGSDVFVLNYSASADQFDLNQQVLSRFLESLAFSS